VDFLGFQRRIYDPGAPLHTVVINAAIWPRRLFDEVGFDERLLYGSDEVDLSYSALAAGYRIEACPAAVNEHLPSAMGRTGYRLNAHASRLRATTKRYWRTQRRRPTAIAFVGIGVVHLMFTLLRDEGPGGIRSFITVLRRLLGRSGATTIRPPAAPEA
jgi:GT2 family glycosyltransferase